MHIDIKKQDKNKTVIRLSGDLSIYSAAEILSQLLEHQKKSEELVLNLEAISDMDTAGFQVLVSLKEESFRSGKELKLKKHSDAVLKLFDIYGAVGFFGDKIKLTPEERQKYGFSYGLKKVKPAAVENEKPRDEESAAETLSALEEFISEVLPIWSRNIETSRDQTETAIVQLNELLQDIIDKTDRSIDVITRAEAELQGATSEESCEVAMKYFEELHSVLMKSKEYMQSEGSQIQVEIKQIIFLLQFSDRVGQILGNVRTNIDELYQQLKDKKDGTEKSHTRVNTREWLQKMREKYVTPEQHANHEGREHISDDEDTDITFF